MISDGAYRRVLENVAFVSLMLRLAVDDHREAFAAEGARGLPDFFHQHAGGVVLRDADALAHELFLVLVGRAERRDDHDVLTRERLPEQGSAQARRGRRALDREGHALVGLQVAQSALQEILVHERVMDQLAQHEDALAGILRERLVGPLDRVFHPEAEAEMAGNDVSAPRRNPAWPGCSPSVSWVRARVLIASPQLALYRARGPRGPAGRCRGCGRARRGTCRW